MANLEPTQPRADLAPEAPVSMRGRRGGAESGPPDPVSADSVPHFTHNSARERGDELAATRLAAAVALEGILPLAELGGLLRWIGGVRPQALRRLTALGWTLGDQMAAYGPEFEHSLSRFVAALTTAKRKNEASGDPLGLCSSPDMWRCFTREGEPDSRLTTMLQDAAGRLRAIETAPLQPSGHEPGVLARRACNGCFGRGFHRVDGGPEWICDRCHPGPGPAGWIETWSAPERSVFESMNLREDQAERLGLRGLGKRIRRAGFDAADTRGRRE